MEVGADSLIVKKLSLEVRAVFCVSSPLYRLGMLLYTPCILFWVVFQPLFNELFACQKITEQ